MHWTRSNTLRVRRVATVTRFLFRPVSVSVCFWFWSRLNLLKCFKEEACVPGFQRRYLWLVQLSPRSKNTHQHPPTSAARPAAENQEHERSGLHQDVGATDWERVGVKPPPTPFHEHALLPASCRGSATRNVRDKRRSTNCFLSGILTPRRVSTEVTHKKILHLVQGELLRLP